MPQLTRRARLTVSASLLAASAPLCLGSSACGSDSPPAPAGNAGGTSSAGANPAGSAGQGGGSAGSATIQGGAGSGGSNAAAGGRAGGGSGGSSGSASSAGSGGAATSGGGSGGSAGAPSSGCAGKDYLLCEDFEATAPDQIPAGWTKRGDAVAVVADEAKHGMHSLKLGAVDAGARRITHDAALLGSGHWGRIFYKVQLPVPNAFVHSTLVALSGEGPTIGSAEFRVVDTVKQAFDTPDVASRHQFLYNVQPDNSGEFAVQGPYDWFFEDEWHCVEWQIDSTNQSYHFYFEGEEKIAFENGAGNYDDSEIPSSFEELRIGWNNYQEASPGFTAWIDDVALAHERIGCE